LPKALLLDLDGTLADTAPDLAAALNAVLQEEGRRPLPFHEVRPHVSFGAPKLVRLGFGEDLAAEEFERLRGRLLEHYARGVCEETRLFDGFEAVLAHLESLGIPWGIVTNKPGWLTDPLLEAMGLHRRVRSVVSGDTLARRKPHPEPLLHAAAEIGVGAAECVYAGDARRDIEAGQAAGMLTVGVSWGYILEEDPVGAWGATHVIDHPSELIAVVVEDSTTN
jgi:2-phosphoglycolate phosphatase